MMFQRQVQKAQDSSQHHLPSGLGLPPLRTLRLIRHRQLEGPLGLERNMRLLHLEFHRSKGVVLRNLELRLLHQILLMLGYCSQSLRGHLEWLEVELAALIIQSMFLGLERNCQLLHQEFHHNKEVATFSSDS